MLMHERLFKQHGHIHFEKVKRIITPAHRTITLGAIIERRDTRLAANKYTFKLCLDIELHRAPPLQFSYSLYIYMYALRIRLQNAYGAALFVAQNLWV